MTYEPPWLTSARVDIGTLEVPGTGDNPKIVAWHGATLGGESPDSLPWCSSFVCAKMEACAVRSTRSKAALSWLKWGTLVGPIVGAIGIIDWGDGKGHVGFVVGVLQDGRVCLLGGNQSNSVCVKAFSRDKFTGFRWPAAPILSGVELSIGAEATR